jgi:adenosylcobinamide kinase/adenosylcobinamide-phosphate guanylyltransferase
VKVLVLGGVRSGKSRYAESLGRATAGPVTLIATGAAGDAEMAQRIAAHRAYRPPEWRVIEEPIHLGEALQTASALSTASVAPVIIVDCLTLWLTNLLCQPDDDFLETEIEGLFRALPALSGTVVFVSNEVGFGIMPVNALARRFADQAGILHQRLAPLADRVVLMVAGVPVLVKGAPT